MPLRACGRGNRVLLGMREKLISETALEDEEREGKFQGNGTTLLFERDHYGRESPTVFPEGTGVRACISSASRRKGAGAFLH